MGNRKQKWTPEEEEALLAGIAKHGCGKWKNILNDPHFAPSLAARSNIDLKDKWRNLSVSNSGQGSRDKSRSQKVKAASAVVVANSNVIGTPTPPPSNARISAPVEANLDDVVDGKLAPKYNQMILDALSSIQDNNGCEIGAIVQFIEQRHEVPQNFKRILNSRLRKLVLQGKVEKVQNRFRISRNTVQGTKTPTLKNTKPRQLQISGLTSDETLEEASKTAAFKVAEAENKSFLAAEAVKEAEKVAKMAEEADAILQFVKEIYKKCSQGEIVASA